MRSLILGATGAINRLSVFLGYSCAVLFAACIILSVYEVVMRYAFASPTAWSFEIIMALCASGWILSTGYVTQQRRHISITMLEMLVSPRTWRRLELVASIVSVLALIGLAWATYEPAMNTLSHMERSGSAFNPPLPTYLKWLLFLGAVLYVLQLLANIAEWFLGGDETG